MVSQFLDCEKMYYSTFVSLTLSPDFINLCSILMPLSHAALASPSMVLSSLIFLFPSSVPSDQNGCSVRCHSSMDFNQGEFLNII